MRAQGTVESILEKIAGEQNQTALDPTLISVKVLELLDDSNCYKFQYQQNKMVRRIRSYF